MIIVRLRGGLGNQMFQYACGRALSLRAEAPLKLDIEGYERAAGGDTPRVYSLSHFDIAEDIASLDEIRRLKYPFGIASKAWRYVSTKIFRRFNIGFVPRYMRAKGDVYLDGFWQTERYFADAERIIRRDLALKKPLGPGARAFADAIAAVEKGATSSGRPAAAVSLHVRRGDVARDAWKNPYYGITTPEYYERALAALSKMISARGGESSGARLDGQKPDIRVFVFSDDIVWAKQNIEIPFPAVYVEGAGIADYEELALMSRCDHNIIANSSFSWWGAWLNPNPDKIVIAPKEWIRTGKRQHEDTIPSSWTRI